MLPDQVLQQLPQKFTFLLLRQDSGDISILFWTGTYALVISGHWPGLAPITPQEPDAPVDRSASELKLADTPPNAL